MCVCVGDRVLRLINLFPCAAVLSPRIYSSDDLVDSNAGATVTGRKLQDTIKSANKIASEWQEEKEIEGNSKTYANANAAENIQQ